MSLDVGNDGKTGFFAVFDGHGGKEVAKFVALKMVRGCNVVKCESTSLFSSLRNAVTSAHASPSMHSRKMRQRQRYHVQVDLSGRGQRRRPNQPEAASCLADADSCDHALRRQTELVQTRAGRGVTCRRR